jgi:hypothetical protein
MKNMVTGRYFKRFYRRFSQRRIFYTGKRKGHQQDLGGKHGVSVFNKNTWRKFLNFLLKNGWI